MATLCADAQALACAQRDFFDTERWPHKPYCSDDLHSGIYPRVLSLAKKKKYIQANPPYLRFWSIFDLDYEGAAFAWETAGLAVPNFATVNRLNGHAHYAYGLAAPVLIDSPNLRQKPLRYLCAVEEAYRVALRADHSFSGLMTKNPVHRDWIRLDGNVKFYELSYLAEFVDLKKYISKKNPELIGIGRNVMLFETLRMYGYKHVRSYKGRGLEGWNSWMTHMYNKALEINGDFPVPLEGNEVWHVSKSVAKWTFKRFDIEASDLRFKVLQINRGRAGGLKSGQSRFLANESKRVNARLLRAKGTSNSEIANALGVSLRTVIYWLNESSV